MRRARATTAASALALCLGGLLAGCGGSDSGSDGGAKSAPSVEQFCGALTDFQADFAAADPSGDLPAYVKALKAAATRLDNVGTPEEMPAEASNGFDVTIDRITALPDAATNEDLAGISDVSAQEKSELGALDDYIKQACPDVSGGS